MLLILSHFWCLPTWPLILHQEQLEKIRNSIHVILLIVNSLHKGLGGRSWSSRGKYFMLMSCRSHNNNTNQRGANNTSNVSTPGFEGVQQVGLRVRNWWYHRGWFSIMVPFQYELHSWIRSFNQIVPHFLCKYFRKLFFLSFCSNLSPQNIRRK